MNNNKMILGLDLGTNSIGWALVSENDKTKNIIGIGSRIIPLTPDEKSEFENGNAITKNQKRTLKRTQRKGYNRYQLRKESLIKKLTFLNAMPTKDLFSLSAIQLYGLRHKALQEKISLPELGRILFHLNQKRGYQSSRKADLPEKQDREYVAKINSRYDLLKTEKLTVGQHFYQCLIKDERYRIKDQIMPRKAYIEEFGAILERQRTYYPNIITDDLVQELRDRIIYYQRPLKSQKGLVSICEFEGKWYKNNEGKDKFGGPRVTPRSSPLFQVCKLWESINNITLVSRKGEILEITQDKKLEIFNHLDTHENLSEAQLQKILGITKADGYQFNKQLSKGIQGNLTKSAIQKVLGKDPLADQLLAFDLPQEAYESLDIDSGEIKLRNRVKAEIENQPLFKLWHILYSIPSETDVVNKLTAEFKLNEAIAIQLARLDFTKGGFSNKSSKAIRNIIPYLQNGYRYSDAMTMAGYNHSDSITKAQNNARILLERLPHLPKNSLRQPVVEKILNQLINLVNTIIERYGKPDEIRVELARELKQSIHERNQAYKSNNLSERRNSEIAERLQKEYRVKANRRNIEKWRLYAETNGYCLYCGNKIEFSDFLNGEESDIEHIIPRSRLFDDSFQNKVISHRKCNKAKGDATAYDYILSQADDQISRYEDSVAQLYKEQAITKAKRDKLLMPATKIPTDFIARQLRETQYISRKSRELLQQVCRNVWATSGTITDRLRKLWGWEESLMRLHLEKHRTHGKTEWIEYESNGQLYKRERISGWTKRQDSRHHALDALTIACTQQSFIQRINTLNAKHTREEMLSEVKGLEFKEKLTLLEKWLISKRPFDSADVERQLSTVLVSYKSGKRVATVGKRMVFQNGKSKVAQTGIIIPRGALSEESVYGKIKVKELLSVKLSPKFNKVDSIVNKTHKALVKRRLEAHKNDFTSAFQKLSKDPIWLDKDKTNQLTHVEVTVYRDEYVIKYPLADITVKTLDSIIDKAVRNVVANRLEKFGNNPKMAFKDIENNPVWFNEEKRIAIRSVRCRTGLDLVAPVKFNELNGPIGYAKPGNNHHIAIYLNKEGKKQEHVVTFWHAVERKIQGLPVVITNPRDAWNGILLQQEKYSQQFLSKLPEDDWTYQTSIQQNEMFVFNMSKEALSEAISNNDYALISHNLFRVRKITSGNYWFNHHLETEPRESVEDKLLGKSLYASLSSLNGIKVRIDPLGALSIAG